MCPSSDAKTSTVEYCISILMDLYPLSVSRGFNEALEQADTVHAKPCVEARVAI